MTKHTTTNNHPSRKKSQHKPSAAKHSVSKSSFISNIWRKPTRLREEDEKVQSVQSGDSGTAVFQRLVKKVYDAAQECDAHELRALKLDLRLLDGHFVF